MFRTSARLLLFSVLFSSAIAVAQGEGESATAEEDLALEPSPPASAPRYSRFSAGPGGPLLIVTEGVTGVLTGGLLGATAAGANGAYVGILSGALLLGGGAAAYSYLAPVSMSTAMLSPLASSSGFFLGMSLALALDSRLDSSGDMLLMLLGSQVGMGALLAATHGQPISAGDAALVGMFTLHTTVVVLLAAFTVMVASPETDSLNDDRDRWLLHAALAAPAVGMLAGGLAATALELTPRRVFLMSALPLAVGFALFYLGMIAESAVVAPVTALGGIAVTLGLTALLTSPDSAAPARGTRTASASAVRFTAVPLVTRVVGSRAGPATGAGLVGRF